MSYVTTEAGMRMLKAIEHLNEGISNLRGAMDDGVVAMKMLGDLSAQFDKRISTLETIAKQDEASKPIDQPSFVGSRANLQSALFQAIRALEAEEKKFGYTQDSSLLRSYKEVFDWLGANQGAKVVITVR